jgi:hypothetical protein
VVVLALIKRAHVKVDRAPRLVPTKRMPLSVQYARTTQRQKGGPGHAHIVAWPRPTPTQAEAERAAAYPRIRKRPTPALAPNLSMHDRITSAHAYLVKQPHRLPCTPVAASLRAQHGLSTHSERTGPRAHAQRASGQLRNRPLRSRLQCAPGPLSTCGPRGARHTHIPC